MGQEGVAGAGRGSQDICTTNRNCNACELFISIFMSVTLTYSGVRYRSGCMRQAAGIAGRKSAGRFTHSSRLTNGSEDRLPSSFIAYQPGLIQRMSDLVSLT
jgi:hypothetical protein